MTPTFMCIHYSTACQQVAFLHIHIIGVTATSSKRAGILLDDREMRGITEIHNTTLRDKDSRQQPSTQCLRQGGLLKFQRKVRAKGEGASYVVRN